MCSKATGAHDKPENLQADSSRKRARGNQIPTPKEDALPTMAKTEESSTFTLLNLQIDQIFHNIKYKPWLKLPKTARYDPDSLKVGSCSFYGS